MIIPEGREDHSRPGYRWITLYIVHGCFWLFLTAEVDLGPCEVCEPPPLQSYHDL